MPIHYREREVPDRDYEYAARAGYLHHELGDSNLIVDVSVRR